MVLLMTLYNKLYLAQLELTGVKRSIAQAKEQFSEGKGRAKSESALENVNPFLNLVPAQMSTEMAGNEIFHDFFSYTIWSIYKANL